MVLQATDVVAVLANINVATGMPRYSVLTWLIRLVREFLVADGVEDGLLLGCDGGGEKDQVTASDWAAELADSLAHRGHGLAQITVASYKVTAGRDALIETAKNVALVASWSVYELSAINVSPDPLILPEAGLIVLHDIDTPLPGAVPVLVGAFQHLIQRDLPVALLVIGTVRGIRALRGHPAMGFLSRAESVTLS
ncbi:hypothetical protein [Arthrobacter sp. H-02-3]|uniref:hypothetical protein n=1 Tax=Arthrobacter sp. H-02-3 TaxID=2703675 RepID=UPI000DD1EF2A|nr:hypothetical protein [Arthrobacter sp. H-02-3]PVZ52608.1 hypothetical protein C9424_19905 [Arthrobacter sp. H-02-3]